VEIVADEEVIQASVAEQLIASGLTSGLCWQLLTWTVLVNVYEGFCLETSMASIPCV